MLSSLHEIVGYKIHATDEHIGSVEDMLFDDHQWKVRYLVIDTGEWLKERLVLVSPMAVKEPQGKDRVLPLSLTKEQIEGSPSLATHLPVSRQHETSLIQYYGWDPYWYAETYPIGMPAPRVAGPMPEEGGQERRDANLRSLNEVRGYHIHAEDGQIGHVDDFIARTGDWTIRYMAIDTHNWIPGKKVLIAPQWITGVAWEERMVNVGLERKTIKDSPDYDSTAPITREYESRLHDYYGKPGYWGE